MKAMKAVLAVAGALFAVDALAVIPGYGITYGKNTVYSYNEYNCGTHDSKDQFFLNYLEYGVTDWAALQMQTVNYPDGSYHDLALGGAFQLWKRDWMALRAGAMYNFGNRAPNDKADSMCYALTASGDIWGGFGYIYQAQCTHACHDPVGKPGWYQQAYLTYNVTDRLTPYVSVTTDLCHVDETTDFSVGGWYTIIRDKYGFQWISLYFDVANLTEKTDGVRISAGFDMLF